MFATIPLWSCPFLDFCLLGFFFVVVVVMNSIFLLVIGLFKSSASPWFSLGRLYVSKNLFTFLGCSICWHVSIHRIIFSYISVVSVIFAPLSLILFISVLSLFFLVSLDTSLSIFFFLPKNQLFFHWFFFLFFFLFLRSQSFSGFLCSPYSCLQYDCPDQIVHEHSTQGSNRQLQGTLRFHRGENLIGPNWMRCPNHFQLLWVRRISKALKVLDWWLGKPPKQNQLVPLISSPYRARRKRSVNCFRIN